MSIHSNKPIPKDSATGRVLEFVRGQKASEAEEHKIAEGHSGGHPPGEEHEEQVHVDERWLIAYADKMTLLAGLFIMLFAMSTLDKVKFQKVQQSAEKSFGKPVDKELTEVVSVQEYSKSVEQLEQTRKELEQAKKAENELRAKLLAVETEMKNRTLAQEKTTDAVKQVVDLQNQVTLLKNLVEEQKRQVEIQNEQLVQSKKTIERVETEKQRVERQKTELEERVATLESKVPKTDLTFKVQELQKVIQSQTTVIEKLEKELTESKNSASTGSFLAMVMSWSTKDHDIDLKVTDPEGRVFDFKKRKYAEHPGLFVLDTRLGPGAEIWQADKILVGTYAFDFQFYNQHGNSQPCPITARLFSPKGGVEIPSFQLDAVTKRNHRVQIQIDKHGNARLKP